MNIVHCEWCGREVPQSPRGRRRKYCDHSCRQRAYEHRRAAGGAAPATRASGQVGAADVGKLKDGLFELRCAAEDIQTAVLEGADAAELRELCGEMVVKARAVEKLV